MVDKSQSRLTDTLVDFASTIDVFALPAAVRAECVRGFAHAVGCIVGGSRHETVAIALAALSDFGGPPVASVLGRSMRTDALLAALINGTSSAAYSYFDTYSDALLHPSGPLVAALLACAERAPVSGAGMLSAFAAGMEIACRLSDAIAEPPAEAEMAWSHTGIVCGPAAAVAVGDVAGPLLARTQMGIGHRGIRSGRHARRAWQHVGRADLRSRSTLRPAISVAGRAAASAVPRMRSTLAMGSRACFQGAPTFPLSRIGSAKSTCSCATRTSPTLAAS